VNSDFSGSDIQQGMDVYDSTGQKIGSVSDVYQNTGSGGFGGAGSWGSDTGVGDVIVEEIDIVTTPDYGAGGSDIGGTGTSDMSTGGGYGTGTGDNGPTNFDTTSTAGFGSGANDSSSTGTSDMGGAGGYGTSDTGTAGGFGTSTTGAGIGTMASTGCFKVSEGGVLGIGATDLYIPFSAVASVTDNQINLNCTKDQAEQEYQQKPAYVDNTDNS